MTAGDVCGGVACVEEASAGVASADADLGVAGDFELEETNKAFLHEVRTRREVNKKARSIRLGSGADYFCSASYSVSDG